MIAEFMFSGFDGELRDLNGPFGRSGNENHGRPVYSKIGTNQGHKVMLYYWDQRDGEQLHGWWIAPEVGGAHVWAMNPIGSATPPQTGWKVPWHGRVNPKVVCMVHGKRVSADGTSVVATSTSKRPKTVGAHVATAAALPPTGPQTAMTAAYGTAFQAWQQASGFALPWQQKMVGGAVPQFTANQIAPPAVPLPPTQVPLTNKTEELSTQIPVELRRAEFERRTEAQQVRFFEDRLHTLVQQAKHLADQAKKKMIEVKANPNFKTLLTDKSEGKLGSDELKARTEELDRVLTTIIRQIQTSKLATSNKILEGEGVLKESKVPIALWPEIRGKLQAYVKECEDLLREATEWKTRKEDKEAVLWTKAADTLVEELDLVLKKAEAEVEKLKDAAALLSSDVADHLNTKELLVASEATENCIGAATKAVTDASGAITEKIPLFKNASPAAFQKFRVLQLKIPSWNEDIQKIQKLSLEADKKGRESQAAEARIAAEKREREKERRFEAWNQSMIDDAWAEVYVVEDLLEAAEKDTNKLTMQRARDAMYSLEKTVEDFIMKKDASNKTREILSTTMGNKVRDLRHRVTECQKKISELDFDEVQDKIMQFAGRVMAFMEKNKKTEKVLFESLAKGSNVVTSVQVRAWCEVVANAKKEEVTAALERADCPRPLTRQTLTADEFPLLFRVFFEACQGATLVSDDEEGEIMEVPVGTLVMLRGVPNKNLLPVKAVHGEGSGLLNAELPGWARVSPYYQCITETVLTNAFEMAGFQLVKRIKAGERLRIIEPPRVCEETGVTRMKAQSLLDGKVGYATVTKPGGPEYLKPDAFIKDIVAPEPGSVEHAVLDGIRCVEGEPIEALKDGEWVLCHLCKISGGGTNVEVQWQDETRGKVSRKEIRCRGTGSKVRLSQWTLSDFVGRIIKKAYDEIKKVTIPEFKAIDANGDLLSSDAIRALGMELEQQAQGSTLILEQMHLYLMEKSQDIAIKEALTKDLYDVAKKHNDLMQKLNDFRHELSVAIQLEVSKARQAEVEKDEAEKNKREKELEERSEKITQQGVDLIEILENLCDNPPSEEASVKDMASHLVEMEKAGKEMERYFEEELEMAKKEPDSSSLVLDLLTLQRKGRGINNEKISNAFASIRKRIDGARSLAREVALSEVRGLVLKAHPALTSVDALNRIFDKICVEMDDDVEDDDKDDSSSNSSSSSEVPQIKVVELHRLEREFFSMSRATLDVIRLMPWPQNRDQFQLAFLNLCRVSGNESADITADGKTLVTAEPHTILEVLKEGSDDVLHVRVLGDEKEGTISAKRTRKLGLKYDILKDTVLTNKVELQQLKVLSRLKKGDKVLAISLPTKASKLLRMRAKLEDETVGWLSMVGNNVEYVTAASWE